MTKKLDWVKKNHLEFNQQFSQTIDYLLVPENLTRMGFKTGSDQETWVKQTLLPQVTRYTSAFNAWKNEALRSPKATRDLNKEEAALKELYRELYTGFLKNSPLVTNDDLFNMRMPERFAGPKQHAPIADTHPASRADTSEIRMVKIHFGSEILDGVNVKKGKPEGQRAAVLLYGFSETPVTLIEELENELTDTNSPFVLKFSDRERGKFLYYTLCWSNTRDERGPFSPILMAVVP
jgi:hypothetical protein